MLNTIFLFIGTTEIIVIGGVALLLFGGKKLPELMRSMGKGVKEFKEGMAEGAEAFKEEASSKPENPVDLSVPHQLEEEEKEKADK